MKTFTAVALSALAILPCVSAHGYVSQLKIDGKSFAGNRPNDSPKPSVIRQVSTTSPVKGAMNPMINCGQDAKPGSAVADAQPGSKLEFFWEAGDGTNWFHLVGPIINYLGSCGDASADKCDSTKVKWFKVDQEGKDSQDKWAQATLATGAPVTMTLPQNVAPGNYLIRHEIVALHTAQSVGGAEFYPSCSQLKIGGNGNAVPAASELVAFPGAYTDTDPGILTPDVFNPGNVYQFPGPDMVSFAAGAGNATSPNNQAPAPSAPAGSAASPSVATDAAPSAAPTKTCHTGQKRMVKRHAMQWSH